MTTVIINPGTGKVKDSTVKNAELNMRALIKDLNFEGFYFKRKKENDCGDGRYCFILLNDNFKKTFEIQMPGLSLEKVRYMQLSNQNIWNFPRLYLDGSSWVWCYVLSLINDKIKDND